jgi:hypothetical protein
MPAGTAAKGCIRFQYTKISVSIFLFPVARGNNCTKETISFTANQKRHECCGGKTIIDKPRFFDAELHLCLERYVDG